MNLIEIQMQIASAYSVLNKITSELWPDEVERTILRHKIKTHLRLLGIWRRNMSRV